MVPYGKDVQIQYDLWLKQNGKVHLQEALVTKHWITLNFNQTANRHLVQWPFKLLYFVWDRRLKYLKRNTAGAEKNRRSRGKLSHNNIGERYYSTIEKTSINQFSRISLHISPGLGFFSLFSQQAHARVTRRECIYKAYRMTRARACACMCV